MVIEAHADEISWFVNYVTKDGYIYVVRNGGSDHQIAPSKRVNIFTRKKGIVEGVFGYGREKLDINLEIIKTYTLGENEILVHYRIKK